MAERLRRSTRNRLGFSRVGSSPAGVDNFLPIEVLLNLYDKKVLLNFTEITTKHAILASRVNSDVMAVVV